jgi:hypothetical protein
MAEVVSGEMAGTGKEGGEAGQLAESYPGGGEAAAGLSQELTLAVDHSDTDSAGMWEGLNETEAFWREILRNNGIGVEKEDIIAGGLPEGLVVRTGETDIFGIDDPGHFRE